MTERTADLLRYLIALSVVCVLAALMVITARTLWEQVPGVPGAGTARTTSASEDAPAPARGAAPAAGTADASGASSTGQRPASGAAASDAHMAAVPPPPADAADAGTAATLMAPAPPASQPEAMRASIDELRGRRLSMPVAHVDAAQLVSSFAQARGHRPHEALDIMASRGTSVLAAEDGRVVKLFWSNAGGHTIYQFDPSERFAYYYAHLDAYADGLKEGQWVRRGQVIGTVGSTGNASADAPHLHFAIFRLTEAKRWWEGTPIDPYPVLRWAIGAGT